MRAAILAGVLVLFPLLAHAEVDVKVAGGRVDVKATAAPLSEVLDRLAKQTGMKVTYDAPVRQPVTVTLLGRTPAEAVLGVLDGLGLNYALRMDLTGTRVEALLITGTAAVSSGSPAPGPAPAFRPPAAPAPEPEEDAEAADEAEATEPPPKAGLQQPGQPATGEPQAGTAPVGSHPGIPTFPGPGSPTAGPMFPVSPFAPTAPTAPFVGSPVPAEPQTPPADGTEDSQ